VGPQRLFQLLSQALDLRQRAPQLLLQRLSNRSGQASAPDQGLHVIGPADP
jgi:hypothetical protein